jgi:predicted acylesterase/phospholipase RssA
MPYTRSFNATFGKLGAEVAKGWPEKEVLGRNAKKTDTLGLALSGGGYRSAIFCYGVLRGLHELGVLQKIDYVSAVSGGSWIATPFAMTERFDYFFQHNESDSNFSKKPSSPCSRIPFASGKRLRCCGPTTTT